MPNVILRDRALDLLDAAYYREGCMCQQCIDDRVEEVREESYRLVYPELPFIPHSISLHVSSHRAVEELWCLRRENNLIKKNTDKGVSLIHCFKCGTLHNEMDTHKRNGKRFCRTCWHNMFECFDCGELHYKGDKYPVYDAKGKKQYVCRPCLDDKYSRCGGCEGMTRKDHLTSFVYGRNERGQISVYKLCKRCVEDNKVVCHSCGVETNTNITYRMGGNHYCPECKEMELPVHPYYYKPLSLRWQRHETEGKVSDDAFHMGFELEVARYASFVDCRGISFMVKDLVGKDKMYCMKDGTIRRDSGFDGVEFVTHPFTWQDYKKCGVDRWDNLTMFLRDKGYKANLDGIGFHVHTTKAAWGPLQIYKLLQFIYGNKPFIIKIAQRKPTNYCVMSEDDFNEAVLVAKDKKNRNMDHYSAINLNAGDNSGVSATTIEFRMFQGTLEPLFLHKNIEFVKACYKFTKIYPVKHMTKKHFLSFVRNNTRAYPCLNEFIKMKGIK